MSKKKASREENDALLLMVGMCSAFYMWILRQPNRHEVIAECFNDLLCHFELVNLAPENFIDITKDAIENGGLSRSDLDKLPTALADQNWPIETRNWLAECITELDHLLAARLN